jgi:hypothetical protein
MAYQPDFTIWAPLLSLVEQIATLEISPQGSMDLLGPLLAVQTVTRAEFML